MIRLVSSEELHRQHSRCCIWNDSGKYLADERNDYWIALVIVTIVVQAAHVIETARISQCAN